MIGLSIDTQKLLHRLERLRLKAIPYAVAMAMTWTAKAAAEAFAKQLGDKLDRPTPFTLRSARFRPANKEKTEFDVYIQDEASKGVPPAKYLLALVRGGYRKNKATENLLRRAGILPGGWQVQPGADAPLDGYGNLQGGGGRYTAILSALKAHRETGFTMNRTAASAKRNAKTQRDYFVLYSLKTKTPTGVYTRTGRGGSSIKQILAFTPKRSKYPKMLDFRETIGRAFRETFDRNFREGLRRMLDKVKSW